MACIIFDLDGTLVDSFPGLRLGLNRALNDFGRPPMELEWVRRHVGRGALRLVSAAAGPGLDPENLLERFRHHYGEVLTTHTLPYPGVDATLHDLAGEHTLAVASNKPENWVLRLVDHLGWSTILAAVVGPESAAAHKPDPAMIHVILQRCACTREQAILVGDMAVDVETGQNAKIPVVGVTTGSTAAEELLRLGCVVVLGGVPELPAWLADCCTSPR